MSSKLSNWLSSLDLHSNNVTHSLSHVKGSLRYHTLRTNASEHTLIGEHSIYASIRAKWFFSQFGWLYCWWPTIPRASSKPCCVSAATCRLHPLSGTSQIYSRKGVYGKLWHISDQKFSQNSTSRHKGPCYHTYSRYRARLNSWGQPVPATVLFAEAAINRSLWEDRA